MMCNFREGLAVRTGPVGLWSGQLRCIEIKCWLQLCNNQWNNVIGGMAPLTELLTCFMMEWTKTIFTIPQCHIAMHYCMVGNAI